MKTRNGYDDNRKTIGAPPTRRDIRNATRRDIADLSAPDKKRRKNTTSKGEKK